MSAKKKFLPLVSAKRGKYEVIEDAKVEAHIYEKYEAYRTYVAEHDNETPDASAILTVALELLFKQDVGFTDWQARKLRPSSSTETSADKSNGQSTTPPVTKPTDNGAKSGSPSPHRAGNSLPPPTDATKRSGGAASIT